MYGKKIGVVSAVLALSLSVAVGPAAARNNHNNNNNNNNGKRSNTFIENDCKRLAQKPRHIELACGRNRRNQDDVELRKVRYRNKQYGKNNVRARANLHIAGTTSGRTQVKLRFKNLKRCGDNNRGRNNRGGNNKGRNKDDEVYRRVTIKLKNSTAGAKKRYNERLGCGNGRRN